MLKKFLALILVVSFLLINKVSAEQSPQWVKNIPAAKTATQLFIVAQVGEKTTAWISMHEKDLDGNWQQIMTTPGFIGKNGLGKTKEGDTLQRGLELPLIQIAACPILKLTKIFTGAAIQIIITTKW